jgi:hypothetical protein
MYKNREICISHLNSQRELREEMVDPIRIELTTS